MLQPERRLPIGGVGYSWVLRATLGLWETGWNDCSGGWNQVETTPRKKTSNVKVMVFGYEKGCVAERHSGTCQRAKANMTYCNGRPVSRQYETHLWFRTQRNGVVVR